MELRIFCEPQMGATYEQQLRQAQRAESLGFGAWFRSDHFLTMGGGGEPGPTDSWVTLGAVARETSRIRLGTLLASATFRQPGILAISVAEVDAMSGGRVELGLGAGWFEAEHRALGVEFFDTRTRFDRLEEQLAIVHGLWSLGDGERFSHRGRWWTLEDNPGLPRPVQRPHPPLIVGGVGPRRTPALAARYADEFNVPFADVATTRTQFERVREACEREGRDPQSLVFSHAITVCCGADEAEAARRARRIGRTLDEMRPDDAAGTPEEVAARLREYAAAGATRAYLQVLDFDDLEHLDLIAEAVAPLL